MDMPSFLSAPASAIITVASAKLGSASGLHRWKPTPQKNQPDWGVVGKMSTKWTVTLTCSLHTFFCSVRKSPVNIVATESFSYAHEAILATGNASDKHIRLIGN